MGKVPRRSREDTRELLLAMGLLVVRDQGFGALTFKNVFDRLDKEHGVRLTNASVIGRAWKNLAEFRADVLIAVAHEENDAEVDGTVGAVEPLFGSLDVSTPEGRRSALRELCRLGGAANLQVMRTSMNWPLWIAVWDLASSTDDLAFRQRIESALVTVHDNFDDRIEVVYETVISLLGFRLREPFTLREFTIAADTLGQGIGLRDRYDGRHMEGLVRPTGPGGAEQEWTLFGVAFEALVNQFFELDPDWHPPLT